MLRAYRDAAEMSRAMTMHLLTLDEQGREDFALALIMELCAALGLNEKGLQ